jgi:hypothetical protein
MRGIVNGLQYDFGFRFGARLLLYVAMFNIVFMRGVHNIFNMCVVFINQCYHMARVLFLWVSNYIKKKTFF